MPSVVRISTPKTGFDLSHEQAQDIQWIVENGRRWSSKPAQDRIQHCLATKRDLASALKDAVGKKEAVLEDLPAKEGWRDKHVVIEVDKETDESPWELLDFGDGPVGLSSLSVVRQPIEKVDRKQAAKARSSLRILLVSARPFGPADVPYLAVSKHFRALLAEYPEQLRVTVLRPPTFDSLVEALTGAEHYDVLHFDGHGDLRPEGPILTFEDTIGGPLHIRADDLSALVRTASIKLVVLNACRSAQVPRANAGTPVESIQSSLAYRIASEAGISVVAMRYVVYADVAGRFVGAFYEALLKGRPVGVAVQDGRQQLAAMRNPKQDGDAADTSEWLLPVCYGFGNQVPIVDIGPHAHRSAIRPIRPIYGRDAEFLALENAFKNGRTPIIHGEIGAGKLDLAHAFGEWFQITTGQPINITEQQIAPAPGQDSPSVDLDSLKSGLQDESRMLILTVNISAPSTNALDGGRLATLVAGLKSGVTRSIIVMDGDWESPRDEMDFDLIHVPESRPDDLAEHGMDENPDIDRNLLGEIIASANGNPMFVRARSKAVDLTATPWFTRAAEALASVGAGKGLLRSLSCFEQLVNIYTIRHMMHETNDIAELPDHFLQAHHDADSAERRAFGALTGAGLLSRFSSNTYGISPWLVSVLKSQFARDQSSGSRELAFARAVAETCQEYQMDYFVRGLRDSAYVVAREGVNIRRAWTTLEAKKDYGALTKIFGALACMWTLSQRFDLIEQKAEELNKMLIDGNAPTEAQEQLLAVRLQAANVTGRLEPLCDAVRRAAERRQLIWEKAGQPRGTVQKGLPVEYFQMLGAKQNLAAILRITKQPVLHRKVCNELIGEWAAAEYGEGVIKAITSLSFAAGGQPTPEQAAEICDLFTTHFKLIEKSDKILQSEILARVAAFNLARFGDRQGTPEFQKALDQAIAWLQTALALLPSAAQSNHATIHHTLADCYLRKSMRVKMDEHFQIAIDIFERIGSFDSAALSAALAASGWKFFGDAPKFKSYLNAAFGYLKQSRESANSLTAIHLLKSLV